MGKQCKFIITILIILSFLCQNFVYAYGQNKLAPESKVSDPRLEAAARAYAEILAERRAEEDREDDPDSDLPPGGGVLRCIIAFILIPILAFMWLASPVNVNTSFAQTAPAAEQAELPQWVSDLDVAMRLEKRRDEELRIAGKAQYDSLIGMLLTAGVFSQRGAHPWGINSIAGLGNPLISYPDEGFGAIGTGFLRFGDNTWLSLRGGVLPDYTPDSTDFALIGIDTNYRYILRPYLHVGVLRRALDGPYGNAFGLLLDGGADIHWQGLNLDLRGSGPLYFRPSAGAVEDYRRVMGDLSLLRARLIYDGRFFWVGGTAELGGLESRVDPELPSNRFSRYGLDGGLKFDAGQVALALSLQGERVYPSFADRGATILRPAFDLNWRDISLRGGVWTGPFVRPYGEVMYRLLRGYLELTAGYNGMPPIYHEGLFSGPFGPRDLFTFGIRGGIDLVPRPRRIPHDGYPVQGPTGYAMREFAYGPLVTPLETAGSDLEAAMDRFERALKEAVTNARTVRDAVGIYRKLKEKISSGVEPDSILSLSAWGVFWEAFYENPNIDFYWMYVVRNDIQSNWDTNVYSVWHENGYSYDDIIRRLLDRRYDVPDINSLRLLIAEFNQAMTTGHAAVDDSIYISLFEDYLGRLNRIEPRTPEFAWTYYTASRLYAVLAGRSINPGIEKLAVLIEAELKIPPDLTGLNIGVVVPDEQFVRELHSNVTAWVDSNYLDTKIQGLLVLEFLVSEKGSAVVTDSIFTSLDLIVLVSIAPDVVPIVGPPEPVVMTRDSAGFKQLKAAILALDILTRINRPPDEDIIRQIKERYDRLPEDLKKELRLGRAFQFIEVQRGAISPMGRMPLFRYTGFLLPFFAGLFLTGCSGTGAGAIGAIGILAVLAAIVPGRDRRTINRRIPLLPPSRALDTEEDCESEAGLLQSA